MVTSLAARFFVGHTQKQALPPRVLVLAWHLREAVIVKTVAMTAAAMVLGCQRIFELLRWLVIDRRQNLAASALMIQSLD